MPKSNIIMIYRLLIFIFLTQNLSCQNQQVAYPRISCDFLEGIDTEKDIECGQLEVPENHDDPSGRKISISFVVLKAKDPSSKAHPFIYLTGGPGGNTLMPGRINNWLGHPVREKRDIILFDQRGIGYSSAIPNMEKELYEIMGRDADAVQEAQLVTELLRRYKEKCLDLGIQLEHYNTFQNARDVGQLMKHLGYEKYNLYGVSYGTRLARVIQDLFPELLHSVNLNSPAPLSGDFLVDRLHSYSLALSRVLDYCKNDPGCNAKYPQLQEQYLAVINGIGQKPLELKVSGKPFFVNAHDAIYFLRRLLYGNDARNTVPELIQEYAAGGGPMTHRLIENDLVTGSFYNFSMWLAVERYENFDQNYTSQRLEEVYAELPLLSDRLGFFHACYVACQDWHQVTIPESDKTFKNSAIPTLITVNQFDPVTPPLYAKAFMKHLQKAQLFILDEGGHGGGNFNCRNKLMVEFMDQPEGTLDSSCLKLYKD